MSEANVQGSNVHLLARLHGCLHRPKSLDVIWNLTLPKLRGTPQLTFKGHVARFAAARASAALQKTARASEVPWWIGNRDVWVVEANNNIDIIRIEAGGMRILLTLTRSPGRTRGVYTVKLTMLALVFIDGANVPRQIIEAGKGAIEGLDCRHGHPMAPYNQEISDLAKNHNSDHSSREVKFSGTSGLLILVMKERKVELFQICFCSDRRWQCFLNWGQRLVVFFESLHGGGYPW